MYTQIQIEKFIEDYEHFRSYILEIGTWWCKKYKGFGVNLKGVEYPWSLPDDVQIEFGRNVIYLNWESGCGRGYCTNYNGVELPIEYLWLSQNDRNIKLDELLEKEKQ